MGFGSPEDEIKYLKAQLLCMEDQVGQCAKAAQEAQLRYQSLQDQCDAAMNQVLTEQQLTKDISRDMTRQYKGMKDDLLAKIINRDENIRALRDEADLVKAQQEKEMQGKNEEAEALQFKINNFSGMLEDQSLEFGNILANVYQQLRERIDDASNYNKGDDVGIVTNNNNRCSSIDESMRQIKKEIGPNLRLRSPLAL